jgi:hypothetical protein
MAIPECREHKKTPKFTRDFFRFYTAACHAFQPFGPNPLIFQASGAVPIFHSP